MSKFDRSWFLNPPKAARPMVRWWWPGLDVDLDELKREAADLDEGYFAGGEVQAFLEGMPPAMAEDPEVQKRLNRYRTPFYFDLITKLLTEFERRGLTLDLTTCSGWPTNGVDVPLSQGQKHLYMAVKTVEGGGTRTVDLPTVDEMLAYRKDEMANAPKAPRIGPFGPPPDDTDVLRAQLRLCGASAARCVGEPTGPIMTHPADVTVALEKPVDLWAFTWDGKATWQFPEGTWQVFAYYEGPNGATSHMASREDATKPNYIVDHFGKDVIAPYLDRHIGAGGWERFAGKTLRAFFTDSFELSSPWTWTDDFFAEFEARRGYDLRPYLMATFVPGASSMFVKMMGIETPPMYDLPDGVGERVRYDYQLTIADLFDDYFLDAMRAWGDEHNLKSRVQCYGHSMDNLKAFGRTQIPETEQLAGNGVIDFLKLVGSASLNYQLPLVTSETLVWMRHDYMTTPTKMKIAADKLFVSGVNQLIYHGMPYRHAGLPFPHFYPFHGMFGSFICRDNTLWKATCGMNRRIARGQALMQAGPLVADVAVYYQKLDYVSGTDALEELTSGVLPGFDRDAKPDAGHGGGRQPTAEQARGNSDFRLSHVLMDAGYDYYHINEECLMRAELIDGCLVSGDAKFKALVMNCEERVTIEAAYKLRALIDAGFPVLFLGAVPDKVPGLLECRKREEELAALFEGIDAAPQSCAPAALRESGVLPGISCEERDLQHTRRDLDGLALWLIRTTNASFRALRVKLNGARGGLRVLGVETGTVMKPNYDVLEDGIALEIPFVPYGSWFILTGEEGELPAPDGLLEMELAFAACAEYGMEIAPEGGWRVAGKNAAPGGADADTTLSNLADWADVAELKGFSGTAEYTARFRLDQASSGRVAIDLGIVGDTAKLTLNGQELGEALTAPYAFEATGVLRAGENEIKISVTNTLRNGLVGTDAFRGGPAIDGPGPRELAMSGILGPVTIKRIK